MSQSKEKISRRRSVAEVSRRKRDSSSTEETSSSIYSAEHFVHVKSTSTPLKVRRPDLEEINRSRRSHGAIQSAEKEPSSDERGSKRSRRHKERVSEEKHPRERIKYIKRRRDRRSKDSEDQKQEETSSSVSSEENYGEGDIERSKRKKRGVREKNELPITEVLKRSQENKHTKYESPVAYPALSTDKIYVQHRDGFSAMKINKTKDTRDKRNVDSGGSIAEENSPPIRVAIMVQEFLKNIGLMCQGFLGGMALVHCIMIHVFFDASMEFVTRYSTIAEIYMSIFSVLVIMCIVSMFDKFDLARFDVEHLRELYLDYNRALIAVPLYLAVFCLHQACARTDNQLNMLHYTISNDSAWGNITETFFDDLNSWQKMSMSKDLLAVLAWLFVSFGRKDDAFLMYLQSMEKYANDIESSR